MAGQRRAFKVAEKIRSIIATELLDIADPRLQLITITSVAVSPDLRHARIYWVVAGASDRIPEAEAGFKSAGRHLRRSMGKSLGTKFVPELKFFYDDTLDTVEKVDRLLSGLEDLSEEEVHEP